MTEQITLWLDATLAQDARAAAATSGTTLDDWVHDALHEQITLAGGPRGQGGPHPAQHIGPPQWARARPHGSTPATSEPDDTTHRSPEPQHPARTVLGHEPRPPR